MRDERMRKWLRWLKEMDRFEGIILGAAFLIVVYLVWNVVMFQQP